MGDAVTRPDWGHYIMGIARAVSVRGSCDRLQVGAVLVDDRHRILSTGYNGSVPGAKNCIEAGHYMVGGHCKRTVHAERNAIAHAARHGVRIEGSWMYVTHSPCPDCLILMAASGVRSCVYETEYGSLDYGALNELAPDFVVRRLT